jgi:hypothetical protein
VRGEWEELKSDAAEQRRSVFEMSSLVALATVRAMPENLMWLSRCARTATIRTGSLCAEALLEHYRTTLAEIREAGYLAYWTREFRPYLRAAAQQFSVSHRTLTERFLQRRASPKSTP